VHDEDSVHEAPFVMIGPVSILALLAVFGGFLGYAFGEMPVLEGFLDKIGVTLAHHHFSGNYVASYQTVMSIIGALVGVIVGAVLYTNYVDRLGSPIMFLKKAFYFDEIYDYTIVRPLEYLARFIDKTLEPRFFDKSIRLTTESTQGTAALLQKFQSGQIRSYVAWIVSGLVLAIVYLIM